MAKPFLTPPSLPETTACRTLQIPDDKLWLGIFNSALLETIYWYNYEQVNDTDLTPEETAAACDLILREMWNDESCGTGDTPVPYWDTAEDSDDEAPPDEQPWYGMFIDETFQATLENWVIAGFVAYAATPAAALTFLTLAPKFRLAFKTGDIGGIIRVFIDAQDAGTIDTFSETPGIIEQDFIADPENEDHQIMLVLEELHTP